MDILAFVLSTLGMAFICGSSLIKGKDMRLVLLFVFLSNALVATSYLLTGAYTGAASCILGALQAIINYFFDRRNKELPKWLIGVYAGSFLIANLLVFRQAADLISLTASLTFVFCIGQKNGTKYRRWTFVNAFLWLIYDVVTLSFGPMLTHGILLASAVSGILMHDVHQK